MKPSERAASTQPATTAPRAHRITSRWRGPSASLPITGVAKAPVIKVIVSIHPAVLSETPSAWAMVGMRGAPRLDTTAISDPARTRVGTRSRGDAEPAPTEAGATLAGPIALPIFGAPVWVIARCHPLMSSYDD